MADAKKAPTQPTNEVTPVAPGTVVVPGSAAAPIAETSSAAPLPASLPAQPAPQPIPSPSRPDPAPPSQPPTAPALPAQPQEPVYRVEPSTDNDPNSVSWSASEFVAHDKSSEWYILLTMGTAAAAALMYLVTKDLVSVGVVIVAAIVFGIFGSHKPRQLQYRVDMRGISIGDKAYSYDEFRSFSVIPEGAFSSIVFMPLKRFAVPINIYYAPEDEERIIELLSQQLPYEQRRRDAVDSLMRKVRF